MNFCILLILGLVTSAKADQVLIRPVNMSQVDYLAQLKADSDLASPTQTFQRLRPRPESRSRLNQAFISAQKSYLSHSPEQSKPYFEAVASLTTLDDWDAPDRVLLATSMMRLAQFELQPEKQNPWLLKVIMLGPAVKVDPQLFPPPLFRRLNQLREAQSQISSPKAKIAQGWTAILVNGVTCNAHHCPTFPDLDGDVRVTFLSDQWQPVSTILKIREIERFEPKRVAFETSDCQHHFSSPCAETLAKKIDFTPRPSSTDLPLLTTPNDKSAWLKSKWLWAGVGVVAAALIIQNNENKNSEKEPSTTYGY